MWVWWYFANFPSFSLKFLSSFCNFNFNFFVIKFHAKFFVPPKYNLGTNISIHFPRFKMVRIYVRLYFNLNIEFLINFFKSQIQKGSSESIRSNFIEMLQKREKYFYHNRRKIIQVKLFAILLKYCGENIVSIFHCILPRQTNIIYYELWQSPATLKH